MTSLIRILILAAAASAAGAINAGWRGLPWVPDTAKVKERIDRRETVGGRHAELRATLAISLDEFKAKMQQGVVIIDARPREEFEKGHLAYEFNPPVLNIEPDKVAENTQRLEGLRGWPLVIYCTSDDCEFGEELFIALEPTGLFFDVKIYFPGWAGLQAAGMPVATGPDTWAGMSGEAPPMEDAAPDAGAGGEEQP